MKISDIESVISVLGKIKKPTSPIVRHKIFSIISELQEEKKIQEDIKKSYITNEVIRIETEKQDLIKSLHSDDGSIIVGEYKLKSLYLVNEFIKKHENHPDMLALVKFSSYLSTQYTLKTDRINIDETEDEMFSDINDDDISILMLVIK